MGDMAHVFKDMRDASKARRAENRLQGPIALMEAGIPYTVYNEGAHIVIPRAKPYAWIDYWPGTGAWRARGWERSNYGVRKLITFLKEMEVKK